MMQKAFRGMRLLPQQARAFSYNYSSESHPRVWMDVSRDGESAGRLVFELYSSHSPALAENFAAFATGQTHEQRSFTGSRFFSGQSGLGVSGGRHEGGNYGSNNQRLADENLEMRHHKRGLVTMVNNGSNDNGSEFMITFGETNFLNGYNNIVGEVVEGDAVLSQLEEASDRQGNLAGEWSVTATGTH